MIILTNTSHNLLEINDTIPFTLQNDKKYFLRVTTGKFTIKAFIQLYFMNPKEDIYINTSNLEYFLFKTRIVKSRICVKREEEREREEEYLRIEREILNEESNKGSKEPKRDTFLYLNTTPLKSLSISFSPNIFLSLKSSLISPSLYFFKETPSSLIFKKLLKRKMSYEEINKIGDIKNLIFTKIIIKEGEEYKINPLIM